MEKIKHWDIIPEDLTVSRVKNLENLIDKLFGTIEILRDELIKNEEQNKKKK